MKVLKYKEGLHIFLPNEMIKKMNIKEGDELEFYEILDNRYVVLKRTDAQQIIKKELKLDKISDEEEAFLRYILNEFKIDERTPYTLRKRLDKDKLKILNRLIAKGIIVLVNENNKSIYHVKRDIFKSIVSPESKKEWDYLVLDKRNVAYLSRKYKEEIKKGEIKGVRGFDGKFYVIKTEFYNKYADKIKELLKDGSKTLEQISDHLRLDKPACKSIIEILLSEGEIIERKKELYSLV